MKQPSQLTRDDMDSVFDDPFDAELPSKQSWRDRIWRELEHGRVAVTGIYLPEVEFDLRHFETFSGRTIGHKRLCARVAAWLKQKGRDWTATSLGYAGGVADVASVDQRLFAECGYTKPEKILWGLNEGLDMLVASYSFVPLLFQRSCPMFFRYYSRDLERRKREAVSKLSAIPYPGSRKL